MFNGDDMSRKTEMVVVRLDKSEKKKLAVLAKEFQRSHSGTLRYLINGAAGQLGIDGRVSEGAQNETVNA